MPRFCPGCALRKLQMNAAPCPFCGRENPVTAPKPREKMHPTARMLRDLLKPLGVWTHGWTLVFCGFSVWAMTLGGVVPFLGWGQIGLLLTGAVAMGVWAIRLATRVLVWIFAPATRQIPRGGGRSFLFLPACLAILALLNTFDVPLRLAFWASRPGLERAILTLKPSPKGVASSGFRPPRRAGFYGMQRLERRQQAASIEVTDNAFLGGVKAGFAVCPQGCAKVNFSPAWADWNAAPTYRRISGAWYWWEQRGSDF